MRGSDGVTVRGLPKRACAANCLHATASRSRQTSLNRKVLMRRRDPGPRATLTKPSSFTCRKAKPQVPWIMPHCRSMSLKLIAATPPPCVTLLSIRARTRRPECGRNLSHAVTLTVNNQRPSASPRPRCPRLWPEITRPSRSSRFKQSKSQSLVLGANALGTGGVVGKPQRRLAAALTASVRKNRRSEKQCCGQT